MCTDQVEERNTFKSTHMSIDAYSEVIRRRTRAGFPATMELGGTSLVTTLPAPTIARSPMMRWARMVAPVPIDAPVFTIVVPIFQSFSVCKAPLELVARG